MARTKIFDVDGTDNEIILGDASTLLTCTPLTASLLISTDASKRLTSVSDLTTWVAGTANQITVTDDTDGTVTLSIPSAFALPGKLTAGSFGSPTDVTNTREYGFELHYSGNNYNATAIRARAHAVTTDTSVQFQGGLFQAANNDNINVGVLNGLVAEAIGKATSNAATISTMRGALIGAEWSAKDTVTNLKTLHVRTHTRDAATEGYVSGTGYGIYIENEAVGGNGQALDAGIYFKGTNLSAGNKAFTHGIDFSGATYGTADIKCSDSSVINSSSNQWSIGGATQADRKLTIVKNDGDGIFIKHVDHANSSSLGFGINTTTGYTFIQSANVGTGTTQPLRFYVGGSNIIEIDTSGNTKVGDGGVTNYLNVAADGELTLEGTAKVKKEFAINAISLAPGATGPDAVILGNSIGYSYDINDDSVMNFEIPYDCDTSEDIKIEIYWYINEARSGSNEEVQWRAQWSACPANATEAIDAPTHTGTIDFGDQLIPTTAKFLTEKSGTIAAASIADGDFVSMTVDRVALDDGNDPTADPVIVQIEVEYTMNKLGVAT